MPPPDPGVALLERALGYTRGALAGVRPEHLHRPTPCAGWDLDRLLDHMHDALEAFSEGALGVIVVDPPARGLDVRVAALQATACTLLGAWSSPGTPAHVLVGGVAVPTAVVVRAAALEITVHGWDVAQATGQATPVPDGLAGALLAQAAVLVDEADRGRRFAGPLGVPPGAGASERLLAHLGRSAGGWADRTDLTGPPGHSSRIRRTQERPTS